MSLQQIVQEFQNWMNMFLPGIWNYPIPWRVVMWSGLGIFGVWFIGSFIGAALGAYVADRYRIAMERTDARKSNDAR